MGRKRARRSPSPESHSSSDDERKRRRREKRTKRRSEAGKRSSHGSRSERGSSKSRSRSRSREKGKKHKHKKRDRKKDKKSRSKHEAKRKSGTGAAAGQGRRAELPADYVIPEITEEDYFARAPEFRVWLLREHKIRFVDLSGKEARRHFAKFVDRWNGRKLDAMYYTGIPDDQLKEAAEVPHKWGFLKQMNLTEKDRLDSLQDSVSHTTNEGKGAAAAAPLAHRREATETGPPLTAAQQCRRRREHEKAVLDELAPKATGREATREKRKEKAARIHGAANDRESAMDGLNVPEEALMGSSTSEFQRLKERRGVRQQRRNERLASKAAEARSREEERVEALKQSLGLQPGQQIKIPPRK